MTFLKNSPRDPVLLGLLSAFSMGLGIGRGSTFWSFTSDSVEAASATAAAQGLAGTDPAPDPDPENNRRLEFVDWKRSAETVTDETGDWSSAGFNKKIKFYQF